jgi:pimeloyl-ACP methyl ester carboxylesterase
MTNPTRTAGFLIGVMLCAGILPGCIASAVAGTLAQPSKTAAAARWSAAVAAKGGASNPPGIFVQAAAPAASPPVAKPPAIAPRGRAYLFRGALGPIFSRGMDRLTERLQHAGITADVHEFTICRLIAETAIRDYRRDPAPIILIGHSMGGLCAMTFAEMLQDENIPVSLAVTIDPAQVTHDVPLNVERFINIFLSTSVLGGGDVKPRPGYQGHYASYDLSEHKEVTHINIDKMDDVHTQLVSKIVQLAATPAKTQGGPLPLRYVVPAEVAVELWDSGMPVFAGPGDTLQSIAAHYQLPLWSLTQANKGVNNLPLVPGERIVVPRHLVPLAELSGPPPSGHVNAWPAARR